MTRRGEGRQGLLFLTPFAIGVVALLVVPMLLTGYYAFTDHTGLSSPNFNGLDNLRRAQRDPFLADSLRASLAYVVMAVPMRLLTATGLGLLLAAPRRGGRLYRAAVYLPSVVPDVALALLFLWILNPLYGPLNQMLGLVGITGPNWFATAGGARFAIALMMTFPVGEAFLVVLAGRKALQDDTYEAAQIDGATAWQQFRFLTFPRMAPLLLLLLVRDTIMTLQVNFVPAYVLTDGRPNNATLFLPVYIFDQAFEFLGFGYGAFLTLILLGITAALILVQGTIAWRWRPFSR